MSGCISLDNISSNLELQKATVLIKWMSLRFEALVIGFRLRLTWVIRRWNIEYARKRMSAVKLQTRSIRFRSNYFQLIGSLAHSALSSMFFSRYLLYITLHGCGWWILIQHLGYIYIFMNVPSGKLT